MVVINQIAARTPIPSLKRGISRQRGGLEGGGGVGQGAVEGLGGVEQGGVVQGGVEGLVGSF